MPLELASLVKATDSLKRAVAVVSDAAWMAQRDKDQEDTLRAGVIQNFEFTYELCWKFIQRWLRENDPEDVGLPRTRKDLFRMAAEKGLVDDPLPWFRFGDARNLTSHLYDESKALLVFEAALSFLPFAESLLERIKAHND